MNGVNYTWDDNGNLLSDGTNTYAYDQANRLRTIVQGANTYTFAYNGLGDRLSQTANSATTQYVNDPSTALRAGSAAGLTQVLSDGTDTYLYGVGRIAQQETNMQYFGVDGLGSVDTWSRRCRSNRGACPRVTGSSTTVRVRLSPIIATTPSATPSAKAEWA